MTASLHTARVLEASRPSSLAIAATALGFVLVQLDVSIVNVALPTMGRELHSGVAELQWVVDAYTVTFAALLLSGGALGDRMGARRAYLGGFLVFVCASIACGFAPTMGLLIGARVAQGIGAALLIPSSLALINHAYGNDARERAKAIGLWTAAGSIALAAGPIAGGALIESIGWRSIFFVNVPLGAIGLWLTLRYVAETPSGKRAFDFPGQLLAIGALGALIADVIAAGTTRWNAPFVLWGFAVTVAFGSAFIVTEARSRAPMLPLDFFRRAGFSAPAIVGFAINLTLYGQIFVLSLFWQRTQGYGPLQTGLAFLPFCAALGVANIVAGRLVGSLGPRLPMIAGLAIAIAGFLLLLPIDVHVPYALLWPGIIVFPFGIGIAVPAMTTALLGAVEKERSGIASGVLNAVRQAAGALGVAILGAISVHGIAGIRVGLGLSAAVIAVALLVGIFGLRGPAMKESP
jgi:DHA2 family methylenomycin A resistance protein-like MFS transporter